MVFYWRANKISYSMYRKDSKNYRDDGKKSRNIKGGFYKLPKMKRIVSAVFGLTL